jgi:hypothetical protein
MTEAKTVYRTALAEAQQVKATHESFFALNRASYERFFDLSAKVGELVAKEMLPAEAATVAEIEERAETFARLLDRLSAAIEVDLFEKIEALARSPKPEFSPVARLRHDLLALDDFRKNSVDGIHSRFWDIAITGVFFANKEKDRLGARLVKCWARERKVSFADLGRAVAAIGNLPKPDILAVANLDIVFENYPFDVIADLKQAETWPEFNGAAVEMLRTEYERRGSFGAALEHSNRFGF